MNEVYEKHRKKFDVDEFSYLGIVRREYEKILKLQEKLKKLSLESPKSKTCTRYFTSRGDIFHSSAITIVFAAFYLEAYIYIFAQKYLSRKYIAKHLEKLSLESKWIIIPKLITGKDYPTGSQAYQDLIKVVKLRNDLAHPKPTPTEYLGDNKKRKQQIDIRNQTIETIIENAHIAIRACRDVLIELFKLEREPWDFEETKLLYSKMFEKLLPLPKIDVETIAKHYKKAWSELESKKNRE